MACGLSCATSAVSTNANTVIWQRHSLRYTRHSKNSRLIPKRAGGKPDTWSGAEYAEHCVDGTDQTLAICRRAVALPESTSVVSLSEAAAATAELIGELTDPQWDAVTDGWSFDVPVRGAMVHLLHDLEHHLLDVRRGYAKLGLADGIEVVTSRADS